MSRAETLRWLQDLVATTFGDGGHIVHVNHGDSHREMLAYNRRCERAYQRSRRNQPPSRECRACQGSGATGVWEGEPVGTCPRCKGRGCVPRSERRRNVHGRSGAPIPSAGGDPS